jgi:hypothetical protein
MCRGLTIHTHALAVALNWLSTKEQTLLLPSLLRSYKGDCSLCAGAAVTSLPKEIISLLLGSLPLWALSGPKSSIEEVSGRSGEIGSNELYRRAEYSACVNNCGRSTSGEVLLPNFGSPDLETEPNLELNYPPGQPGERSPEVICICKVRITLSTCLERGQVEQIKDVE